MLTLINMTFEHYLLICLAEEASELAKAAIKAARFGLQNHHPRSNLTNSYKIRLEMNDVLSLMDMLYKATHNKDFFSEVTFMDAAQFSLHKEKVLKYYNEYYGERTETGS